MAKAAFPQARMNPVGDGCWYCGEAFEPYEAWHVSPDGAWHEECQTAARLWEWAVAQHRMSCHLEGCRRDPVYPFGR